MKIRKYHLTRVLILLLFLIPLSLVDTTGQPGSQLDQISDEPIVPSNPSNVVIRESAIYDAPIDDDRPIAHFSGLIYWTELAGSGLNFFINTSDVITSKFYDYETGNPMDQSDSCISGNGLPITNCVQDQGDRYLIIPEQQSFAYEIDLYYDPDIVEDTGFIVVFNSQSVDFSLTVDGETRFARVDYSNEIVLPKGAGLVSWAPIDNGFITLDKTSEGRFRLFWEYVNRQMDTKHDPLMISVTYTYDEIFLAFTEQVYQNQQEQQRRQEEVNRLNLLKQSFVIIATFAIIASLFSILFAYLLARRKFEPKLQQARELPRREAADIEDSPSLQVPVRSTFLTAMILIPILFMPISPVDAQVTDTDRIQWDGTYDLRRDLTLVERINIELPIEKNTINIYANTSEVTNFEVFDEFGNSMVYDTEDNRFIIQNPGLAFSYNLERPYTVHNNSDMLVWLDRFWLEFSKPIELQEPDDLFFHVDLSYSVILPQGAILYSASPSELLEDKSSGAGITTEDGRTKVTFVDEDRQMDAFHDVFETQVTFSFIGILDALENLNSDFIQVRAEKQDLEDLVQLAATEVLLFSILGLIAPLISFFVAYWVFRRQYMKLIERTELEQEEKIFIESVQIQALTKATDKEALERLTAAYQGHYYRLLEGVGNKIGKDIVKERMSPQQIIEALHRNSVEFDPSLLLELLSIGASVTEDDQVSHGMVMDFSKQVDEFLEILDSSF